MKRTGAMALLLLPAVGTAQTVADEPSFHYLETAVVEADVDVPGPDLEGDGYRFEYAVDVRERAHLFGSYERFDIDDVDGDSTRKLFGVGAHFRPAQKLSVFGRVAYTDVALDLGAGNVGDDGVSVTGGVRYLLPGGWEVRGSAEYVSLDDGGSDTYARVGADFFVTDAVALAFDLEDRDQTSMATLALRFYFDNDPGPGR